MKWVDYRERLGIGFDDDNKFKMLKAIFKNYIDIVVSREYSEQSCFEYCQMTGEPYLKTLSPTNNLLKSFSTCNNSSELVSKFVAFHNTYIPNPYNPYNSPTSKNSLKVFLKNSLNKLNVKCEIIEDKDGIFVFPKGAQELDNALVSQPLEWLKAYPETHNAFIKALKSYSEATDSTASDVADLFRKALETFFQEFFNSTKSLENLKSQYGTYMKNKGVPIEISNNLETLQQAYTNFMNGYAKHHDKTSINVLEYIMYQTGNIIRLLIILKRG